MIRESIEHIDIPFDELKIFTGGAEDKYQQILI